MSNTLGEPTILIVEDERPQLDLLKRRAEQAGFTRINHCSGVSDAIAKWEETGGCNVVLLDLNLGGGNDEGYAILRYIRNHARFPERVFIRSAYLSGKTFSLESVALYQITFYLKDEVEHEARLDTDLREFVAYKLRCLSWDEKAAL